MKLTIFLLALVFLTAPNLILADEIISVTATVGSGVVPDPGGGGGGGGGGFPSLTAITFSGRAYPLSKVTILRDGVVTVTTIAGPDAKFTVTLTGLTEGNFTFAVYSEDSGGRRSAPFSFPLYLTSGATTTVSGIFIAPTIDVDKSSVKRGDNISIFGVASPSSEITISVHSPQEHFVRTDTDASGVYLYTFDTSPLDNGGHETKSKARISDAASEFSNAVAFSVGDKNISKDTICATRGDFNSDCRVNIVDFSVLAYWYKRSNPPSLIDLNGDNLVTIVDFSILAYGWTG